VCLGAGVARYLRSRAAAVRVYRVDPPSVDSDRDSDGSVDGVFTATEREVAEMSHYLVRNEGLFVGRVAAANVCGYFHLSHLGCLAAHPRSTSRPVRFTLGSIVLSKCRDTTQRDGGTQLAAPRRAWWT
jgi:hypothetical protein